MDQQLEEYRRRQQERFQNTPEAIAQRQKQELEDFELAKKLQEELEREEQIDIATHQDEQHARQLHQQNSQSTNTPSINTRTSVSYGSRMYPRPEPIPSFRNHYESTQLPLTDDDMEDPFGIPSFFAPPMPFGPPSPFASPPSAPPFHPLFQLLQQLHPSMPFPFSSGETSVMFPPGFPSQVPDDSYESLLRLSEMFQPVNRGATQEKIKELPTWQYVKDPTQEAKQCGICLADYEEGETLKSLPKCLHSFHGSCIDKWLGINKVCPVCRAEIE
mmetsp:Transcript_5474/g.7683  ORF Transcript_5474/g.7683 Transcript_5474/m.7683 type:complete len:274 (-) Transcript_5474:91-912(-)